MAGTVIKWLRERLKRLAERVGHERIGRIAQDLGVSSIDRINAAVRDAYPDLADQYLAVVYRWLWWSGVGSSGPASTLNPMCGICHRSGVASFTYARPEDNWDPRQPFALCEVCVTALRELSEEPPEDDLVLDKLKRALDPDSFNEISLLQPASRLRTPTRTNGLCCACLKRRTQLWEFAFKNFPCTICLECLLDTMGKKYFLECSGDPIEVKARYRYDD